RGARANSTPDLCNLLHGPPAVEIQALSLHDALPISEEGPCRRPECRRSKVLVDKGFQLVVAGISWRYTSNRSQQQGQSSNLEERSEEHTSELQSRFEIVCRLLLEKKKIKQARRRE